MAWVPRAGAKFPTRPGFAAPEAGSGGSIEESSRGFRRPIGPRNLLYVALTSGVYTTLSRDTAGGWNGRGFTQRSAMRKHLKPIACSHVLTRWPARRRSVVIHCASAGLIARPSLRQLPEHAGFTTYSEAGITDTPRLGSATPFALL